MGVAFDYAPERPENIDAILNGLDRYNPETTSVFQDYVATQCAEQQYDAYANLALLKLYQFNPHLTNHETTTNILVKALTVFPSPDFNLCLALLPPHVLQPAAASPRDSLAEAVQHLCALHEHLTHARYADFWSLLSADADDAYGELTADVAGFEDAMRIRIAVVVSQCVRTVARSVLAAWLNLPAHGPEFEHFVAGVCGWAVAADDEEIRVPLNKENEARSVVQRETVSFDQFSRMVKRAYEQPA